MGANGHRLLPLREGVGKPCCYCKRLMLASVPEDQYNPIFRGQCVSETTDSPELEAERQRRLAFLRNKSVTNEHIRPRSRGGTNEPSNLKYACARCNSLRGSISHEIFEMFAKFVLQAFPDSPTIYLRAALLDFITTLAEIAVSNRREARRAMDFSLKELRKNLKHAKEI